MFGNLIKKVVGSKHDRELKKLRPLVAAINEFEPKIEKLDDVGLRRKTSDFRQRADKGESLDDLLPEAFAVCREAGKRALGMRHYDVQMIGGITLHNGKIAEMKTGEGKTLVATLAAYLNALEGKGVHVVTVNDYLARRDAEWMSKLYGFLGLSTGVVVSGQGEREKMSAYRCDIAYGQNNEFGFDYLRDNMKFSIYDYVQRELNFAIVDEVDSILIDEARTPLIISGRGRSASEKYEKINEILPRLRKDEHFTVDEKNHSATLTDDGIELAQRELYRRELTEVENLFEPVNLESLHILQQLLKAHTLYKRDQNYMVSEDGKVMIIDEFTGRVLPGRRWSDGLHQAVEAKENVRIQEESATMATISFQNLFRLYNKLSGMTGTADTEAAEFHKIYKLDVSVIPTNKPILRDDHEDLIYLTEKFKFKAVAEEIMEAQERGQPVLVGTTSVEKSDALASMLGRMNIEHNVLNAKQHEREAYVVAQAGRSRAVTVATNMAGRGTDIVLGGNPEMIARYEVIQGLSDEQRADPAGVEEAITAATAKYEEDCAEDKKRVLENGGLYIIGTERHESRRIDNQLRGRGGRQGDPGASLFYLSLEDDLMRIFAGDRMQGWMDKMGMEEDVPIEHKMVSKAVENAQTKVEQRNFDIRKNMLEYDDVMNQQRKSIYSLRRQVLQGQYRTEPTEQQREAGVVSEPMVKKRDMALTELSAPIVEEMVKAFGSDEPPTAEMSPEEQEAWRQAAMAKPIDEIERVAAGPMAHQVYTAFGCRLYLDKYAEDPKVMLEYVRDEVSMSLSEQRERLLDLMDEIVGTMVEHACPAGEHFEDWNMEGLGKAYTEQFGVEITGADSFTDVQGIAERLYQDAEGVLKRREKEIGPLLFLRVFRNFFLQEIDNQWLDHLQNMESLRDGIGLRGYGQRDPKKEYQKEGFEYFLQLMQAIKSSVVQKMYHFEIEREDEIERLEESRRQRVEERQGRMRASHADASAGGQGGQPQQPPAPQSRHARRRAAALGQRTAPGEPAAAPPPEAQAQPQTVKRDKPKVGRNDPCWCGSGKKYKTCHLRSDREAPPPA